jgi:hypothetical protein
MQKIKPKLPAVISMEPIAGLLARKQDRKPCPPLIDLVHRS